MNQTPSTTVHRRLEGMVVNARMARTVSVRISRMVFHKKLQRYFRRDRKLLADSGSHTLSSGDKVVLEETRPLSRHKRWKVVEIVQHISPEE